ncbi:MAG: hypothetical protein R2843_11630 [Thermomicrobiales bacterium]
MPKKLLSELLPRLNNRLTGSGSAVGNLEIKAGRVIELLGLGDQFSGLYRITSATHTIDAGGFGPASMPRKEIWFGSIPVRRVPADCSASTAPDPDKRRTKTHGSMLEQELDRRTNGGTPSLQPLASSATTSMPSLKEDTGSGALDRSDALGAACRHRRGRRSGLLLHAAR